MRKHVPPKKKKAPLILAGLLMAGLFLILFQGQFFSKVKRAGTRPAAEITPSTVTNAPTPAQVAPAAPGGVTAETQPAPGTLEGAIQGMEIKRQPSANAVRGAELAKNICQACHLFPEPSLVDKYSWGKHILPKMMFYLGVIQLDVQKTKNAELYKATGLFPSMAMIPKTDWEDIVAYYLDTAPETIAPQPPREEISIGLKLFELSPPRFRRNPPLTTLTQIEPEEGLIFSADATEQAIDLLGPDGVLRGSIPVGNIPVSMRKTARGLYVGCIGHFFPSEEPRGQLLFLESTPQGVQRKVLLSPTPRVSHLDLADFNGDGRMDVALCLFGYMSGRFSWLENLGGDEYREHVLFNKAGAIRTVIHDFNQDKAPDIALLVGQETEGLTLFYNDGKGAFTPKEIFRRHSSFGHSYFELADFNHDGRPDFLVTNGDNGDYESPPKPYHGIRIYLNRGQDQVEEAFFFPLNGAYKAMARDFDRDGDLDIAAISFFPDYEKSPRESFVYLENLGGLKFTPSTFRECISGRWLTMDVGDVDGDGDEDIALGSLIRMPTKIPDFLKEMWEKSGPSVVILRNKLR